MRNIIHRIQQKYILPYFNYYLTKICTCSKTLHRHSWLAAEHKSAKENEWILVLQRQQMQQKTEKKKTLLGFNVALQIEFA